MKPRMLLRAALAALLCGALATAGALENGTATGTQAPAPSGKLPLDAPLALRGTLGDAPIQANLRAKTDEDGFEGDYFLFGHSQKILLAGEIEGDDVFMEESVNGTDVSGQWNGKLSGDTISGTWQSADGLVVKPFSIRIVRAGGDAGRNRKQ